MAKEGHNSQAADERLFALLARVEALEAEKKAICEEATAAFGLSSITGLEPERLALRRMRHLALVALGIA